MRIRKILAPTLAIVLFSILLIQLPVAIAERSSTYELFDPLVDVRRILMDHYVEKPDERTLLEASIHGMIESLDDPHTQYVPPADKETFDKVLRGTYAGIGAEVNFDQEQGYMAIITPMDDSPALEAGVMAGDLVLEIEGESTFEPDRLKQQRKLLDCVDLLTGEEGTTVTIKVRHLDDTEEVLEITRRRIVTRTVKGLYRTGETWRHCVDKDLGLQYVRLTQFNEASAGELRETLNALQSRGLNGLILDLRGNPGGSLDTAVAVADLFLADGLVVSVRPRTDNGDETSYRAKAEGTLPHFPMIIMVDGQSASASEIVSGALQENGRAKVLGSRTYGKGSVQEVRPLRFGGGTLKYTTAHYYLPSGRNLHRHSDNPVWGVDPDPGFVIYMDNEAVSDNFLARREYEAIHESPGDLGPCVDAAWIREKLIDEPLALAVEALRTRVRGSEWPKFSEEDAGVAEIEQELSVLLDRRNYQLEVVANIEQEIRKLQRLGEETGRAPLLPEDADLLDGLITLRDRFGNRIGTFRIEGGDVAMALESLALEPVAEEDSRE